MDDRMESQEQKFCMIRRVAESNVEFWEFPYNGVGARGRFMSLVWPWWCGGGHHRHRLGGAWCSIPPLSWDSVWSGLSGISVSGLHTRLAGCLTGRYPPSGVSRPACLACVEQPHIPFEQGGGVWVSIGGWCVFFWPPLVPFDTKTWINTISLIKKTKRKHKSLPQVPSLAVLATCVSFLLLLLAVVCLVVGCVNDASRSVSTPRHPIGGYCGKCWLGS